MHRHTPLRQGDQEMGIHKLFGVDDCDSQRWTGGDWGGGIYGCLLEDIDIPPSGRAIKVCAFSYCTQLTTTILNDGLEVIGKRAFYGCALVRINIPPSVRAIKDCAFCHCHALTTVILNDGLEEIGEQAFCGSALVRIDIPPSIRVIHEFMRQPSEVVQI